MLGVNRDEPRNASGASAGHAAAPVPADAAPGKTTRVEPLDSAAPTTAAPSTGPTRIVELRGGAAKAKLAALGGKLATEPALAEGRLAVVGAHVQYKLEAPVLPTMRMGVHQWTHDGPDGFHMQSITGVSRPDPIPSMAAGPNGMFVNAHDVEATALRLAKSGIYRTRAWIRAGVDEQGIFVGYELYVDHEIEAVPIERALHEAHRRLPSATDSFDQLKDTMDVQSALLRPDGPESQNRDRAFRIATGAANPAPTAKGALTFSASDRRDQPDPRVTYHWYVSAQSDDSARPTFAGKPRARVAGRAAYDFGTGLTIQMPAEQEGLWVIWYLAKDAHGAQVGEASYVQTILRGVSMQALEKHDAYMTHLGELAHEIEGEKVPVRAVHLAQATGYATQLRLFIGRKPRDAGAFVLIDVTPGVDPKANRLEYTAATAPDVIEQFLASNKYPKGRLRLNVGSNSLGIDTHLHERETSGQGTLDSVSSGLSIAGMAALGLGLLTAPLTRGQSLQLAMVVVGSLNAAASAVSLYERLQHAEVSGRGVVLDVVMIASSLLNAGGAVRARTAGPAVLLADRATKFLLWSNLALDSASALLISAEGMQQLAEIIDNEQLRPEQKREAVVRVVTNLVMAGAMLAVSYGPSRELRARIETSLGRGLANTLDDNGCAALSLLDNETLQRLKAAPAPELPKLVGALKEEPALAQLLEHERRLSQLLPLMKRSTADDLRFAIVRANAHAVGVSQANSERLVTALAMANISPSLAMNLGRGFLSQICDSTTLAELEHVVQQQRAGKIQGLEDWLAFGAKKTDADLSNVVVELREAQRQSLNHTTRIVRVGGDAHAPRRVDGSRMQSFDQTVETPRGSVEKSVEITTIAEPLRNSADLAAAVHHGTDKVKSRIADRAPIAGDRHLSIYAELAKPRMAKGGTQTIESDGKRLLRTKHGRAVDQGNLFEQMAKHLDADRDSHLLDEITLIDRQTGVVIVTFRRAPSTNTWHPSLKRPASPQ